MVEDIFGRKISIGDYIYTMTSSISIVSTDSLCLVVGENLALSPIVSSTFTSQVFQQKNFWFSSALLIENKNKIETQRWEFLKCMNTGQKYTGEIYDVDEIPLRSGCVDIVGETLKVGDLVYLDNRNTVNTAVSKLNIGMYAGTGLYYVFNSKAQIVEQKNVYNVYKIKDTSSEIEKFRGIITKQANLYIKNSVAKGQLYSKYKGYKPKPGQVMLDDTDIFWIYLGDNIKVSLYYYGNLTNVRIGNFYGCLGSLYDEEEDSEFNFEDFIQNSLCNIVSYAKEYYGNILVTKKYSNKFVPFEKNNQFYYMTIDSFVNVCQPCVTREYRGYKLVIERLL